jgi:hypothetical protein
VIPDSAMIAWMRALSSKSFASPALPFARTLVYTVGNAREEA